MYLFQKIEEIIMQTNTSNKIIGEFILREKSELHNYSMQNIADLTYTSKPTLVRFAKSLGFSGWKEFMKAFVKEANYEKTNFSNISPNFPFDKTDSTKDIIRKLSSLQVESILDTANLINLEVLEHAVDLLLASNRIVMFGYSPNIYIEELFKRKMMTIGRLVDIAQVGEGRIMSALLKEKDCAIIISYSGNNKDLIPMSFIKTLKENNVSMIGITSGGDNYIREQINCVLTISSRERLYSKVAGFTTEGSIMHILNILYSCYFARNYQENLNYKIKISSEFEQLRSASLNNMKEDITE
ncbi:MurR/RpiR family transcriptional regulator [Priestia aryabhattai]|uniref:MurR/RpiR family transcriptional regulator n=1 Tax=Priestia aryabhattai TaxID=412384 RepID=UPI00187350FF|nr:MurR/RpiR family transcriptional regulator [Priestia aryabhattai]MBE5102319.1 MurR/RpiR family transcriptional regulator [Priestia aryabhattai]